MKAIRLVLTQNKAHYRKEESVTNKMTYPLPPFSTVIGAIHNACNYTEYHPMDLSIQGCYESMGKEVYTDHCFLNSVMDDRGILIKSRNGDLQSTAFDKVAKALKSTGNSFRKGITIQIYNQELMDEYLNLRDTNDTINAFKKTRLTKTMTLIKTRKTSLKEKKKNFDKKSEEFKKITSRENEIKSNEKKIKKRLSDYTYENYTKEISKYQSLTTAPKYYEVLYEVKLIIHIRSEEQILQEIKDNIFNLRAIGRSEDFVEVEECEIVELKKELKNDVESPYSAYLSFDDVKNGNLFLKIDGDKTEASGTKYYLNKNYELKENKRIFNKKNVIYSSDYVIEEISENTLVDDLEYIINFN